MPRSRSGGSLLPLSMPGWKMDVHAPIPVWAMSPIPDTRHRDPPMGRIARSQMRANMRKTNITASAVAFINEVATWFETQQGPGYVPVITWVMMITGEPDFVPHLGLAFEKPDVVDRSRVMQCNGEDVEIFQYVPEELFGEY